MGSVDKNERGKVNICFP